jgi:ABC-type nitrate/sulfonate/bicarbonate transport system substrate-binding protein
MNTSTNVHNMHLPNSFPPAEKRSLTIGFIPLLDCVPVFVAKELGFFEEMGLDVTLSRESSWASIRDKVQFGLLDAAPMPAGIVLASAMKLGATQPMVTAMGLGQNGNAITVSAKLWRQLNPEGETFTSQSAAEALKAYLKTVEGPINVASVHTYSTHHFLLREWLTHFNIDPDNKIKQHVVPPPHMIDAMQRGAIDIFCAGEPWNSLAQAQQVGHTLLSGYQIWENAPDKVLGVTRRWHDANPACHQRLIAALLKACLWLDNHENKMAGFRLLNKHGYIDADLSSIDLDFGRHCFTPPEATFPWLSQAQWFTGHISALSEKASAKDPAPLNQALLNPPPLTDTYLIDTYRTVAENLNLKAPTPDTKSEGTPY